MKLFKEFYLNSLIKKRNKKRNSGLPLGAVRCDLDDIDELYEKIQLRVANSCNDPEHLEMIASEFPGLEGCVTSSSLCTVFNNEEYPMVRGHRWRRGYCFETVNGSLIIFLHRLDIIKPELFKPPLFYKTGNISDNEIEMIARIFFNTYKKKLCKQCTKIVDLGLHVPGWSPPAIELELESN